MPTNAELYEYYCRRSACHPNSSVKKLLEGSGSRTLETVDVSSNYLGPRGLLPVLDLVKNTKSVHTLDISNNDLGLEQVQHLAYCLALHPCLRRLILRRTSLQDAHIPVLLQLLDMNSVVEEVDLEDNASLSTTSLKAVTAALSRSHETQQQRRGVEAAHAAFLTEKAATTCAAAMGGRRCFSASLVGRISAAKSGGYVHFATWWKNPQFAVTLSRASRVLFVLECTQEDTRANQMGLMVLRHDGVHRTIEIRNDGAAAAAASTVVAESAVGDRRCTVETYLDVAESYVVMPYTFNPGRSLEFRLTATLVNDHVAQEEGWISLEPIDPRYDWCTCAVEDGVWTAGNNAGGSGRHTSWRCNDMYHLTYDADSARLGQHEASRHRSSDSSRNESTDEKKSALSAEKKPDGEASATIYVLLVKEADPYSNDDRAIGIDVVTHDPYNAAAPPLVYTTDVVCATYPHAAVSFALLQLRLPLSQLDVYVVPSTELPGQTGTYTLTIFSSFAVQLERSVFPHGWRYRALSGVWDEMSCGGCRAECGSWKNNPAVEVHVADVAQPLIACVELREEKANDIPPVSAAATASVTSRKPGNHVVGATPAQHGEDNTAENDSAHANAEGEGTEESPEIAQRKAELLAFHQRHRSTTFEVGVMVVEPLAPAYPTLATSTQQPTAVSVVVTAPRPAMYIVPMLRHAAEVAAYTLELFSPTSFVVDSSGALSLATRERQAQLAAYTSESEQRVAILQAAGQNTERSTHDTAALQAERAGIFERVAKMGGLFVDRDFPPGTSSLFLDPSAAPPLDFPVETTWVRVSELSLERSRDAETENEGSPQHSVWEVSPRNMTPPVPYGPRHWFASVLQAVAAKPGWLSHIFVQYAREVGFAQFAFYKQDDWVGITVDDFLLVDNQRELVYGHSVDRRDFFFALAEKAYAKLHRCYEALEPKVNAAQTTLELLCQGLRDVTSGFTTVQRIRTLETKTAELPDEARDELWRCLKRSIEPSLLCSLMLEGGGDKDPQHHQHAASRERAYVGLLPDRLYGVMDARFVEQQRLVKIRLFHKAEQQHTTATTEVSTNGNDNDSRNSSSGGWKGKWAFNSPRWTTTLRDVLHYHSEEPDVAWIHFDELLYYFTHVLVTEVCPRTVSVVGSFAEAAGDAAQEKESTVLTLVGAGLSLRNPQFALAITPATTTSAQQHSTASASGVGNTAVNSDKSNVTTGDQLTREGTTVEVHIGLHRRDPRCGITRAKNATAQFKTKLGCAVFATEDNTRRLRSITDAQQVLQVVKPNVERDQYITLRLSTEFLQSQQITIMPFREYLRDPDVSYTLSASCAAADSSNVASLQLTPVAANTSTSVRGRWEAGVKAGPPNYPSWRNNPEFFLSVKEATEVTLTLRPSSAAARLSPVGFTVHNARRCSSFLIFDPDSVVASATTESPSAANAAGTSSVAPSCVVRLAGMAERRGMPYIVVPYSASAGNGDASFELEVTANRPVQLRPIDPRLDWHRVRYTVSISAANGNTGGNPAFPSWRFNTQLALTLPVERDGRLFISARRLRSADPRVKVGMLLLHAGAPVAGCYRRCLTYTDGKSSGGSSSSSESGVVARSVDGVQESVLDTTVSLPRDHGALILVVYADQPYKEAEVELSFYAAATLEVQPVVEWPTVLVQEGSWNLGTTAAGSRSNFASWINNPFFGLTVLRPTEVTLLLVQYPRDHEHPVVRRHGAQKSLLPPPLIHPDRCTAIQLSVAKYDATLTEVATTVPTTQAETVLTLELSPVQPYFVVPCTAEPQHDGDFKLFAFADHPIELYVAEKPRLPYV